MFSGSEFQNHHRQFIARFTHSTFIDLSMKSLLKAKPIFEGKFVFTSVKEFREAIIRDVNEKTYKTPVIIIQ